MSCFRVFFLFFVCEMKCFVLLNFFQLRGNRKKLLCMVSMITNETVYSYSAVAKIPPRLAMDQRGNGQACFVGKQIILAVKKVTSQDRDTTSRPSTRIAHAHTKKNRPLTSEDDGMELLYVPMKKQ